jgi:hypothetical protein
LRTSARPTQQNPNKFSSMSFVITTVFQVKTVPKLGEQPAQPAESTAPARIVPKPKERQGLLLRNFLKRGRGSN